MRYNPYSKDAIKKLKEIAEHSIEYKQAIKIMFHNLSIEEYFNQFNHLEVDEIKFKEMDELSKAIFHKISNQLFILKNRVTEYVNLDEKFKNLLEKIENISLKIDEKKLVMKKDLGKIEYRKRLTTYSEKNIKNFKEKTFTTTSGCNIIGYNANLHLKINIGDCNFPKTLSVYFYDSEIKNKDILFGLNPIKKYFKFCISRDGFSLQAI